MKDEFIVDSESIYRWIEEICSWGIRRSGYAADIKAEHYILEQFRQAGLENVRAEPVELPFWEPINSQLTVSGSGEQFSVACFQLPHSAPVSGLELELEVFDKEHPGRVMGKAALHSMPLVELPPALLVSDLIGGAPPGLALELHNGGRLYDPQDTLRSQTQILPFPALVQEVMEPSMAAGAGAFIGVLDGYPGDSYEYYVPYDAVERAIPGVWISGSNGQRITDLLSRGRVTISLHVESVRRPITSHNIVGELPGLDSETVIVGTHHDGPWASAVEDASGIALLLAQVAYWSRVAQRPHRLQFLVNAGHMTGGAGAAAFIQTHRDELDDVVLEIHLEHAAAEVREQGGHLVPTGLPEPRWFFTSRNPQLEDLVFQAIVAEGLDRSLLIPPDKFGDRPTTDGGAFHLAGVPLVNYLTAPFYLFDSMDTPDKIHKPSLGSITRATIAIIEGTAAFSARSMRRGIRQGSQ